MRPPAGPRALAASPTRSSDTLRSHGHFGRVPQLLAQHLPTARLSAWHALGVPPAGPMSLRRRPPCSRHAQVAKPGRFPRTLAQHLPYRQASRRRRARRSSSRLQDACGVAPLCSAITPRGRSTRGVPQPLRKVARIARLACRRPASSSRVQGVCGSPTGPATTLQVTQHWGCPPGAGVAPRRSPGFGGALGVLQPAQGAAASPTLSSEMLRERSTASCRARASTSLAMAQGFIDWSLVEKETIARQPVIRWDRCSTALSGL